MRLTFIWGVFTLLTFQLLASPAVALDDENSATHCAPLKSALNALIAFSQTESSNLKFRDIVQMRDSYPTKKSTYRRPKAIDRSTWRSFEFVQVETAVSLCDLRFDDLSIDYKPRDGFEELAQQSDATSIRISDIRKSDSANAWYLIFRLTNDRITAESPKGWMIANLLVTKEENKIESRVVEVTHAFFSGKKNNAVVINYCSKADDLSDCRTDVQFVRIGNN